MDLEGHDTGGFGSRSVPQARHQRWQHLQGNTVGRIEVSEANRLRTLEDENTELKRYLGRGHAGQCAAGGSRWNEVVTPAGKGYAAAASPKTSPRGNTDSCSVAYPSGSAFRQ